VCVFKMGNSNSLCSCSFVALSCGTASPVSCAPAARTRTGWNCEVTCRGLLPLSHASKLTELYARIRQRDFMQLVSHQPPEGTEFQFLQDRVEVDY
jgi:hypothetical protein